MPRRRPRVKAPAPSEAAGIAAAPAAPGPARKTEATPVTPGPRTWHSWPQVLGLDLSLPTYILLALLLLTAVLRFARIDYPTAYVYDEVYHLFTAREMVKGAPEVWDPYAQPPPGVAYEWTHPPLAKEVMALSLTWYGPEKWWPARVPGALLGVVCVFVIYQLGLTLLRSVPGALFAAAAFSLDGLNFVQSRTAMNDVYMVTFSFAALLLFLHRRERSAALLFGLAFASKWSAIYLAPVFVALALAQRRPMRIVPFIWICPLVYLLSYLPFFLSGRSPADLVSLHQQMWHYHTNLQATHQYASQWWSWPLNLYPVWYHVAYLDESIATIWAAGNPVVFWGGLAALLAVAWQACTSSALTPRLLVFAYAALWLPYAFSPRIMFLYHYSPAVPVLCLALGSQAGRVLGLRYGRWLVAAGLAAMVLGFALMFPFLTGIPVPREWMKIFFLTNRTKNPFEE